MRFKFVFSAEWPSLPQCLALCLNIIIHSFLALGVLDRYTAVPSASHSCVRQCVRATLAQLLGSASPDVRLRVRSVAVTDSVRFCGGGIDSFLGFEYGVVITLASRVFEYFFRFFLRACGFCAFLASLGSHGVVTPPFWPTLTFSSRAVPLLGF